MILRSLLLLGLVCLSPGCQSVNPWAQGFSPTSFRSGFPPVAQARAINVGHVDPHEVYERDFGDTTLVGTSVWTGYGDHEDRALDHACAVGADLVLLRRRFAVTESHTSYDGHGGLGNRHRSVVVQGADGQRTRVFANAGPIYEPRTRTRTRYTFTGVFLRSAEARDAAPEDGR